MSNARNLSKLKPSTDGLIEADDLAPGAAASNYIMNRYTSPATWTKPANLKAVKVTVQGAGGASGSSGAFTYGCGGGGGGGTAIYYAPASSIPAPQAITAGAGTNSFGSIASATAGADSVANSQTGGNGGSGSGGTINIVGGKGGNSGTGATAGGAGGTSIWGAAGRSGGEVGGAYGGGGGGLPGTPTSVSKAPYAGGSGIVIIEEFY